MKNFCNLSKLVLSSLIIFSSLFFVGSGAAKVEAGQQAHKSIHPPQSRAVNKKTSNANRQNKAHPSKDPQISPAALKHIKDRHWYQANQGLNTSHFNHSMTDQKLTALVKRTVFKGTKSVSTQNPNRLVYQYSFNKPIGTTTTKTKAYGLKVITDSNLNVITAFPL